MDILKRCMKIKHVIERMKRGSLDIYNNVALSKDWGYEPYMISVVDQDT